MKKYIHITKETREFLMKVFGVTQRTVFNAMNYTDSGDNDSFRKMRSLALQKGGIAMAELPLDEMLHDSDGYMRQWLPNGAMLEISKKSDCGCDVFLRGEKVKHYDNVLVSDIPNIQNWAMALR